MENLVIIDFLEKELSACYNKSDYNIIQDEVNEDNYIIIEMDKDVYYSDDYQNFALNLKKKFWILYGYVNILFVSKN